MKQQFKDEARVLAVAAVFAAIMGLGYAIVDPHGLAHAVDFAVNMAGGRR